MNAVLVRRLIVKDWYLSRVPLVLIAIAGACAIGLMYARRDVANFIGLTSSFIVLIFLSIILPITTIVNERKRQNLAFVMSLPISPADYTAAKILANLSAFVVLWMAIAVGVLGTITRAGAYGGLIPVVIVAALAPFLAFCLLVAVSLVLESEMWAIAVMSACNISYSFAWFFLMRVPGIRQDLQGPLPVWSRTMQTIIGVEVAVIALAIGGAFFFQSRKTDFI